MNEFKICTERITQVLSQASSIPEEGLPCKKAGLIELYQFLDFKYYTLLVIGVVSAVLGGLSMTMSFLLSAKMYSSSNNQKTDEQVAGKPTLNFYIVLNPLFPLILL